jgi:hypothetical protein
VSNLVRSTGSTVWVVDQSHSSYLLLVQYERMVDFRNGLIFWERKDAEKVVVGDFPVGVSIYWGGYNWVLNEEWPFGEEVRKGQPF